MFTRKLIFILAFFTTACISCDKLNNNSDNCYSNDNLITLMHNSIERAYILYVPASYDASKPIPLLMNFHGFGDQASSFMNDADLRTLAESDTFLLAYPQGSCADGVSHWNPCPLGGSNKSSADDVGFVETMIDAIAASYSLDSNRIYATGYSNGGMMAYGLAHFKSNLIAAVASVSGAMLDCYGPPDHPMPVVHLHGTSDGVIPFDGNSDYASAQSTVDYWVNFNNNNISPTINTDNSGSISIEHTVYSQGDSSVQVELYKYIGGGHDWFNSTYQGQNTAALIWNFVSRYDINGLR